MKKNAMVVITQLRITHYRVAFFDELRRKLEEYGVDLVVLYGQSDPSEISKHDSGSLLWGVQVTNCYWRFGKKYLAWQPFPSMLKNADLIIITQENRILSNYFHLLSRIICGTKIAFWGHGANLQSKKRNGLKELYKRWTTTKVDWWFAYTKLSLPLVAASGFPESRITVINNAVDTSEMLRHRHAITKEEIQSYRNTLGFCTGPIGVYVGSLYADKRLDFLFASADCIHETLPDFNFLIIGDGNERDKVISWCVNRPWARWVGARLGKEKVAYLSISQLMLNPGLVGLGILDSFVCEVPLITTNCGFHSPEIAYLENGVNGLITEDDLDSYVNACVAMLQESEKLALLKKGCSLSAQLYTLENMACRFAEGIVNAIKK